MAKGLLQDLFWLLSDSDTSLGEGRKENVGGGYEEENEKET